MKRKAWFLLVSLLALISAAPAQTVEQTLAYADSLFDAGRTTDALPVYERTAFFMRPSIDARILGRLADCFYDDGNLEKALEYYDHSYFAEPNDSIKKEILFRKSACFLKSHNYNFALIELLNLEDSLSPHFEHLRNLYLGITYFGMEDFDKAGGYFAMAAPNQATRDEIRRIFDDRKAFFRPKPRLAFWLSLFIPGSGQIYAGQVGAGINSLMLTGLLIGLGFYIASVSTPLDAIFTALPWFQRYYQGGYMRATEFATTRRMENRNRIFNKVLELADRGT
jgi:TM2 domain-containing membrane protein YozV